MEVGSNEAIKRAVEGGVGLALFPPSVAASEIKRGLIKALRVRGAHLTLSFNVVYHKVKELSPLIQAFLKVLADERVVPHGKKAPTRVLANT
jgi:DNA-binding transcriptional LysR family regulator